MHIPIKPMFDYSSDWSKCWVADTDWPRCSAHSYWTLECHDIARDIVSHFLWWKIIETFVKSLISKETFQMCIYFVDDLSVDDLAWLDSRTSQTHDRARSPVNPPHKGPVTRSFDVALMLMRANCWINRRVAGDLRRYDAHCDAIVMSGMVIRRFNVV